MFERFSVDLPVKFKGAPETPEPRVFLKNASAQGAQLISRERFYLNDFVSLEVRLPDGLSPLILHGQVVWMSTVEPDALWRVGLNLQGQEWLKLQHLYAVKGE